MVNNEQLQAFCDHLFECDNATRDPQVKEVYHFERGRKYARIVRGEGTHRSAWGFIDARS